ncbi:MAG: TatD family hydrolase [Chloroflexota bacterium]|nr:TatD family hydrolase [Chloroflexota bacterium]
MLTIDHSPMFIDTHCHLNFHQFDEDRDLVVQRAAAADVPIIINPAIDLQTSKQAIDLADRYPGVFAMVGVHPNDGDSFDESTLDVLRQLAAHPKVVAVGEIGLDYYWQRVDPDKQQRIFRSQLELAAALDLPVVIHCRDAHDDVRGILREWVTGAQIQRGPDAILGVLHAFSGDLEMAQEAFDWHMVVSLGGPVTFRNARELHALVRELPLDCLILETDAPYLTPHPYRGKRNEPAYIPLIGQGISDLVNIELATVAEMSTSLARRTFFKLDG